MIYLDYSATTPVNHDVLDSFNKACLDFLGNSNSLHKLGIDNSHLIDSATKQINELLKLDNHEIIYTSGASESNNLAIKGVCLKYSHRGKHIITTHYEHSSVNEPIKYLESLGYEVSYVNSNEYGVVDINHLKELLRDDTIFVSVNVVNSEIGIRQPVEEIANVLKDYPKCFFHVDLTQGIGKVNINLENIDLISFSAHKIYGLKGIGCLIRKNNVLLEPLIHGGKSTSIYRSGTPAHPLIVSISKALRIALSNVDKQYNHVFKLNNYIRDNLKNLKDVYINSNNYCIPHILNLSIKGIRAETIMRVLEEYDIFVSTKTACSDETSFSESVYNLTKNMDLAKSSIRISLSYLTTQKEIDEFIRIFNICYSKLKKVID